jgi:hypothetical protein
MLPARFAGPPLTTLSKTTPIAGERERGARPDLSLGGRSGLGGLGPVVRLGGLVAPLRQLVPDVQILENRRNIGLMTAPCGVPSSVSITRPSSSTPAASHLANVFQVHGIDAKKALPPSLTVSTRSFKCLDRASRRASTELPGAPPSADVLAVKLLPAASWMSRNEPDRRCRREVVMDKTPPNTCPLAISLYPP